MHRQVEGAKKRKEKNTKRAKMLVINILALFLLKCFFEYLGVVLLKFVPHLYLGFRGTNFVTKRDEL
ncbi:hypothetical protein HYN56_19985 [Flavobacterium crocinum]|uniref:Uncharacterized protein n=1 Tax=Flavobacterium crocinum TaxID=2183896 RepID=A0A2S1YQV5_9FLAO|nr:hypothetical protein HYN56_19985 [Flavobacterium crocinum]